jgi:Flp pilus assembly protein TadB
VVLLTHGVSLLGLVLLTTAMVLSVWLLVAFLWSTTWALVIAGSLLLFVVVLWIALPWWMLTRQRWPHADVRVSHRLRLVDHALRAGDPPGMNGEQVVEAIGPHEAPPPAGGPTRSPDRQLHPLQRLP